MNVWFLFGLCGVGALIAFWAVMKPFIDDNKVRGKVLNFDEGMKNYFFRLSGDAEALSAALEAQPEQDTLAYAYDAQRQEIVFRLGAVEAVYRLAFFETAGQHFLRVSRAAAEREQGNIPYLVNAFFIKHFGAKALDYRQFAELFPEAE